MVSDMKLKHITFTGIDAKTDIQDLIDIQRGYPIVEFGVLTSYHWYENGNRYLNPAFLSNLWAGNGELNLSLHICGSAAHDAVVGDWHKINDHLFETIDLFKRIQVNVANRTDNPDRIAGLPNKSVELIIQQTVGNTALFGSSVWLGEDEAARVSMLLDASGGRGIDTPLEVWESTSKIGYAGGFNPDNVAGKLEYLLENVKKGTFWIDMESGVRTDDWFDTTKVRQVITICREVIKDHSKNVSVIVK